MQLSGSRENRAESSELVRKHEGQQRGAGYCNPACLLVSFQEVPTEEITG